MATPKERAISLANVLRHYGLRIDGLDAEYITDALTAAAADAWDEGFRAGDRDAPIMPENPYRKGTR